MVAAQLELILEVQTEEYWQDVTAPMLEDVRRRLRALIKLIEVRKRPRIYTDFEDEIGAGDEVTLPGAAVGTDMQRFRLKVRHFLKDHMDNPAIQKLRLNEPLTLEDMDELQRVLVAAGVADPGQLLTLRKDGGLGLLIRQLVGLDRQAAKRAFVSFIDRHNLTANQTEFLNLVIDYLTDRGVMEPLPLREPVHRSRLDGRRGAIRFGGGLGPNRSPRGRQEESGGLDNSRVGDYVHNEPRRTSA